MEVQIKLSDLLYIAAEACQKASTKSTGKEFNIIELYTNDNFVRKVALVGGHIRCLLEELNGQKVEIIDDSIRNINNKK